MGLFDGVVGGAVGAGVATILNDFIQKQGGVRGIRRPVREAGSWPNCQVWVSTGENQPITADQMHRAVGYEKLQELGTKLGISPDEMAAKLSQYLPNAIDKLTPRGNV